MAVKLVAILTVFMTWALVTSEAALVTSTTGTGPVCGNHTCAKHARCDVKKGEKACVCNKDFHGVGSFTCINDNDAYCAIFNDPSLKSFDGSFVRVPGEQMTFAAHIGTKTCLRTPQGYIVKPNGSCDVRVYSWYCRRAGKFFVCGTVVKVIVFMDDKVHYHTTRIQGKARKGQYTFKEEGQTHEFGNGEFGDPVVTRIPGLSRIATVYDNDENFAYVDIAMCGVKVGLRPAESVLDPLKTPAGLVVIASDKCEPKYLSVEQTVCAPPEGKGPSLQDQVNKLTKEIGEPVTKEDLTCHKVICGDINQNFPGAKANLNNFHETCNSCDKKTLIRAIQHCCFILHNPPFVNCYDHIPKYGPYRGSNKLISLLDKCLFSFCSENSDMCRMVQNSVTDSGCTRKIPQFQQTILNSTCDFYSQ